MSIGATLQQARGARGLTREQLVVLTRISLRIIAAMEQDQWEKVPPGIFARGYLRAYAREVGLDGDALAARFEAEQAPPPPAQPVEPVSSFARPVVSVRWPTLTEGARRWLSGPGLVALLVLVYVAGRLSAPAEQPEMRQVQIPAAVPVAATGTSADQPRTVPTSSPPSPAASSPAIRTSDRVLPPDADAPLVLDVEVTRACWVTASADATRVIYRLLQPGERVQARGRVLTLRVGDAGALRISLDGEPAKPLGASGEVVNVRITRDNFRSLLPPRAGD